MDKTLSIKDKILSFLEKRRISRTEFFERTGITSSNFKGKNLSSQPGSDMLVKILTEYPELSAEWLLTNRGPMIKSTSDTDISTLPNQRNNNKEEGIPLIPFHAMAGILSGEQTAMDYECERYVVPAFRKADYLIQIRGNSMTPTYLSGDIVACQRITMGHFFQWNEVYVLDTDQGVIIKRVKRGTDAEHLLIISDNPDYEPFELHHSEVYHMALVQGIIRSS